MKKGFIIGIGLFLLIISILFDKQIVNFVVSHRINSLNSIIHFISFMGSAFSVIVLTTVLFVSDKESRKYIPVLWLTLVLVLGLVTILKYLVARPRPLVPVLEINNNHAFPSGHAAAVFAPLVLIDKLFPKIKWLWLAIGILILFSRMYLGAHFMSDVISGALIGYISGILILRVTKINF